MGHLEGMKLLVNKGADASLLDTDGDNILHLACNTGLLKEVHYVLSLDVVDINSRGWRLKTPVMMAAEEGYRDLVELLINKGAHALLVDIDGNNFLHLACENGFVEVAQYILSQNLVNIEIKNSQGQTAVMMIPVSPCPPNDCNLTSRCLETGCGNDCEQPTLTPLPRDAQAEDDLHQACETGNLSAVRLILCQRRVDINCRQSGSTPVMRAARMGHLEVMKLLVNKGANVSLANTPGNNMLHLACVDGPVEVVQYVLPLDVVDINSRGWNERTPLMIAGITGTLKIVDVLVSKGGDVSLVDKDSNNILHLAYESGQENVALYVLSLGVVDINSRGWRQKTPVMLAAEAGYNELVESLVRKGANVSLLDTDGNNVLHLACAMGNVEVVRYVLSQALINIDSRGHDGKTPLMQQRKGIEL
ncbi:ankyrin repeat and KH domain-containing protein mask-like [Haliotis rubra]|uniref:ankyrin repeat and KH domain-containing protein mask-like n=1 Tax=Haliotis rubra TaxID=36100 RepID=UPI001EE58C4A|nr:ankyrin repeat and KH domain-containing protein mask-like [Haliotis rubra]